MGKSPLPEIYLFYHELMINDQILEFGIPPKFLKEVQ